MQFRVAGLEDVEDIDRLLRALAESTGELEQYAGDVQALLKYGFTEQRIYHALLAEQDGVVVGLCTCFAEFSTWRCRPGVYVQDLYLDPHYRGRGAGKQFLSAVIRYAEKRWQANYLRLSVLKSNHQGRAFYDTLGFSVDAENNLMVLAGEAFEAIKSTDKTFR